MKLPATNIIPAFTERTGRRVALGVMENLVMTLLDGRNTIRDISDACGLEIEMAQRMFKRLNDLGLVELPGFVSTPYAHTGGMPAANVAPATTVATSFDTSRVQSDRSLDDGMRQRVEAFFAKVGTGNLYELLEIPPVADRKEIRTAYFRLSKMFHPDRSFGKDLGDLLPKMDRIFHEITRAYDVLSNNAKRAEYDARISSQIEIWKVGNRLDKAAKSQEIPSPEPIPKCVVPQAPVGRPILRTRSQVDEARHPGFDAARASANPARGIRSSIPPTFRPSQPPLSNSPVPIKSADSRPAVNVNDAAERREQWKKERIQRAFGASIPPANRISASHTTNSDVSAAMENARIAIERMEYDAAEDYLKQVLSSNDKHSGARELLEQIADGKRRAMAMSIVKEGRILLSRGSGIDAMKKFERALAVDKENQEARFLIASILVEQNRDIPRALGLVRELLARSDHKGRYYALFGEILVKGNQHQRAIEAFDKAVKLEPLNEDFKKRLKVLRG